jgi:hypothetical protein
MPPLDRHFFTSLGLGLLIISAGAVCFALLYLVPYIGIALILSAILSWVLVLSYKLGNALLRPSVWEREAFNQPSERIAGLSPYIRKLTQDYYERDAMKKIWFYPGEFERQSSIYANDVIDNQRLEQEREDLRQTFKGHGKPINAILDPTDDISIGTAGDMFTQEDIEAIDGLTAAEQWELEKAFGEKRSVNRWFDWEPEEGESH